MTVLSSVTNALYDMSIGYMTAFRRSGARCALYALPIEIWFHIFDILFRAGHTLGAIQHTCPLFSSLADEVEYSHQTISFNYAAPQGSSKWPSPAPAKRPHLQVGCNCVSHDSVLPWSRRVCPVLALLDGPSSNPAIVRRAKRGAQSDDEDPEPTPMHPAGLGLVSRLTALAYLELWNTMITVQLLSTLARSQSLRELRLRGIIGCGTLSTRTMPAIHVEKVHIHALSLPSKDDLSSLLYALCTTHLRSFTWIGDRPSRYPLIDIFALRLPPHRLTKMHLEWSEGKLFKDESERSLLGLFSTQHRLRELAMFVAWDLAVPFPRDLLPQLETYEGPVPTMRIMHGRPVTDLGICDRPEHARPVRQQPTNAADLRHLGSSGTCIARLSVKVSSLEHGVFRLFASSFPSLIELNVDLIHAYHQPQSQGKLGGSGTDQGPLLCTALSELFPALSHCRKFAYDWSPPCAHPLINTVWGVQVSADKKAIQELLWVAQGLSRRSNVLQDIRLHGVEFLRVDKYEWKVYGWEHDRPLDVGK